eukprot:CAMPEP_0118868616 /NCGR_PEP_ID=MMETSP1163-20130328/12066_1 /TAXON_ID=124430 /ORGANISM="Phaeomonas parva, Strain CCMP2877" /LENGTH=2540 /DNA_ID=CAMNT_0006803335 /DNA_START=188 /DNA_END=7810 /DNA_ORIENTATION=-
MGSSSSRGDGLGLDHMQPLQRETQQFAKWRIDDVRELHQRFLKQVFGFSLVQAQFDCVMAFKEPPPGAPSLEQLFQVLDHDSDGRIDGLELIGGLALTCRATFEEKARFCFELYDFNLNAALGRQEMVIMMQSAICGMVRLTGSSRDIEPSLVMLERLAAEAFDMADTDKSNQITFEEFVAWARSNREVMGCLERLNRLAQTMTFAPTGDESDSAEELDLEEDESIEMEGTVRDRTTAEEANRQDNNTENASDKGAREAAAKGANGAGDDGASKFLAADAVAKRFGYLEPTNYAEDPNVGRSPDSNLELEWVHGFRSADCRNNVRYVTPPQAQVQAAANRGVDMEPLVVYPAAALAVVYNPLRHTQRFYPGHTDDVLCVCVHPKTSLVASGQVGRRPSIQVWDAYTLECKANISGFHTRGVGLIAFSGDGTRTVSVGLDADHSIAVHDWSKAKLLASGKGHQAKLLAVAFHPDDRQIVAVGQRCVKFFEVSGRALTCRRGVLGHAGKMQTFLSVAFIGNDTIVGCASGELYRFSAARELVQVVQAHGINEGVYAMCQSPATGGVLTGGKDGLVICWDGQLANVGDPLDLTANTDASAEGPNANSAPSSLSYRPSAVSSVHVLGERVLVGSRSSQIYELNVDMAIHGDADENALTLLVSGHYSGELWGLSTHPRMSEFATCGDDHTVRIWSLRRRVELRSRHLPTGARALCYAPCGDMLAVGMINGAIALLHTTPVTTKSGGITISTGEGAMNILASVRHTQRAVTDMQFDSSGRLLAVGSRDSNVYLYTVSGTAASGHVELARRGVCCGHGAAITHLDWSKDGCVLRSTCEQMDLKHWDHWGNETTSAALLRDVPWETTRCPLGWEVQGIWPARSSGDDVNAVDLCAHTGMLATGDDFSRVKLFTFPCATSDALFLSYTGHAGDVTNVRFTRDSRFLLTTGGRDLCVFQWKHTLEDYASEEEDAEDIAEDEVNGVLDEEVGGDKVARSALLEAARQGKTQTELLEMTQLEGGRSAGDEFAAVKPWLGAIMEPTDGAGNAAYGGATDVDLNLCWVHGYRSGDCRNNLRYTAAGDLVFMAAALGVVYSKGADTQRFVQGVHTDDVLSLAMHPGGRTCATGEVGRTPKVVVWDVESMEVQASLKGFHTRGVSLLAFNGGGDLLATVGLDDNHSIAIYNWRQNRLLGSGPSDKGKVLGLCFAKHPRAGAGAGAAASSGAAAKSPTRARARGKEPGSTRSKMNSARFTSTAQSRASLPPPPGADDEEEKDLVDVIVTCGKDHVKFWLLTGRNLKCQKAVWGKAGKKTTMMCAQALHDGPLTCVTAAISGALYLWRGHTLDRVISRNVNPHYPHAAPINAMHALEASDAAPQRLVVGDRDGIVSIWTYDPSTAHEGGAQLSPLGLMTTLSTLRFDPAPVHAAVRSVCVQDQTLLIGTQGSEIYEVLLPQLDETHAVPVAALEHYRRAAKAGKGKERPHREAAQAAVLGGTPTVPCTLHVEGHCRGEVWGLAAHPSAPKFVTCGDDATVRVWNLEDGQPRRGGRARLGRDLKLRALDFSPSGAHIAVAATTGHVYVLTGDLQEAPAGEPRDAEAGAVAPCCLQRLSNRPDKGIKRALQWVQELRYSFDGRFLAVGSHDNNMYLWRCSRGAVAAGDADLPKLASPPPAQYEYYCVLRGHSSYITHLDFGLVLSAPGETLLPNGLVRGADGETRFVEESNMLIQSNCGAYELLFWRCTPQDPAKKKGPKDAKREPRAASVRDATWASWTCTLGWPVQGIWPAEADGTDINAVCRNHMYRKVPAVATADDFGTVKLFNYPCAAPGASDKTYRGHSSHVTNVRFSANDEYLLSTGGDDGCVFVWHTDCVEEARELDAARTAGEGGTDVDAGASDIDAAGVETDIETDDEDAFSGAGARGGGDEFMAVKPWLGAIREPSGWREAPGMDAKPAQTAAVDFVHGFRAADCRNNVLYAGSTSRVVYPAAGLGVVLEVDSHRQWYNQECKDDVLSIAVHPEGHTVATGEQGKRPRIALWDVNSGATLQVMQGFHRRGVSNLAFSASGALLASVGLDDDHSIAIYRLEDGSMVASGKGDRAKILDIAFNGEGSMITVGKKHVKFWSIKSGAGELASKKGIFGRKAKSNVVVAAAYVGDDAVTGQADGSLYLWKDRNCKMVRSGVHSKAINSLDAVAPGDGVPGVLVSGGKDGLVVLWNDQLAPLWMANITDLPPEQRSLQPDVRSVCAMQGKVLVGTLGAEIYELTIAVGEDEHNFEVARLGEGHYKGELWGLATHPSMAYVATGGDDCTVRVWDAVGKRQFLCVETDAKVRALAYSPAGTNIHLAVALYTGVVVVYSEDLSEEIASTKLSDKWIQAMKYAPNGETLAVGAHDQSIYLLETNSYSRRAVCRGHSSYISNLDWSADSKVLQSTCGAYELLFWNAEDAKQITSASDLRDTQWATWTLTLGWPVQHIWPEGADGTDVNAVDRLGGELLATADDFGTLKLFRYPAAVKGAQYHEYGGHASHVTNVRFARDGGSIYTTGGNDRTFMQWRLSH